nr:hypothetical protein [Armatimonas sp.]
MDDEMTQPIYVYPGGPLLDESRHWGCPQVMRATMAQGGTPFVFQERPHLVALLTAFDTLLVGLEHITPEEVGLLWEASSDTSVLPPGLSTPAGAQAIASMLFPARFDPALGGEEAQCLFASLAEVVAAPMDSAEARALLLLANIAAARWRLTGSVRDPELIFCVRDTSATLGLEE